MNLTREDLDRFKYDPNKIQHKILTYIKEASDGNVNITDPTNPFIMGLEANAVITANALEEMTANVRKINPSLARNNDDLFHHLTDDEYIDIFSTPSTASIILFVNLKDILNNGVQVNDGVKCSIPRYTEVSVDKYIFTLLNNIDITVYNNRKVFVEHQMSDNDINVNEIGILESNIISDDSGVEWVILETLFKQVKRVVEEDTIIVSTGVHKEFILTDNTEYFYSNVYYKNNNTDNKWVKLDKTHSDIIYNRDTPIVKIGYIGNKLKFDISRSYLGTDKVSGNIKFEIFTTQGKLDLALNKYSMEDFTISLGETGVNELTAVSPQLQFMAKSRTSVNGGKDGKTVEQLKQSIIDNVVRNSAIPITEYELKEYSNKYGYDIYKVYDTITNRLFTASKKTPTLVDSNIKSRIDTINGTVRVELGELLNHPTVINDKDSIIIKSNTILKEENGKLVVVNTTDLAKLNGMNKLTLAKECKKNRYFFNPYYYIVNKSKSGISSKIYNLDNPMLKNMRIINKAENDIKVNISSYDILKTNSGYKLLFKPVSGVNFDKLNKSLIKMQINIPVANSTGEVKFTGKLDSESGLFMVDIDTDFLVKSDNSLNIINGNYVYDFKTVNLDSSVSLYIYSTDTLLIDNNKNKLNSELIESGEVLIKENFDIVFGEEITYLWDKLHLEYTPRKYKRATTDVPLTYVEDVFEFFNNTGSVFNPTNFDEKCKLFKDLQYRIIHHKGDIVYDYNKIVYKYKKGDILRDDNNNPIIDEYSGVVRYIDMLVINYEYLVSTNSYYKQYLKQHLIDTDKWIMDDMQNINKITLDNTIIKFKPYKGLHSIKVLNNNKNIYLDNTVSPKVTLYISKEIMVDNDTREEFKTSIGDILHSELEANNINLTNIKNVIISKLPIELKGVKIERVTKDELEAFNLVDSTERLSVNKILTIIPDNSTIVEYDIELEIIKI